MNSLVLLTAMTATTGLFGGRHHKAAYSAPAPSCQAGRCGASYAAPAAYAPAPMYAPAPAAYAPAPMTYSSHYYPAAAAPVASCATGNCPRR